MKKGNNIAVKIGALIFGIIVLAFAWWTISPLFIDTEVQEEIAVNIPNVQVEDREREDVDQEVTGQDQSNEQIITDRPVNAKEQQEEESFSSQQVVARGTFQNNGGVQTFEFDDEDPTITTREQIPELIQPAPVASNSIRSGSFNPSQTRYDISGTAYVSGQDLSLVDFSSKAVPDGRVYLAKDPNGNNFIDLGKLKGNKGNQNYNIPASIDASEYSYVVIWCRAFSVFMGSAQIN